MSACFCASVIVIAPRFAGLRSGVCVSSSPVFVGSMADGTGKDGMSSLDDMDALADAIAAEIGREVDYLPVDAGGAARAAARLAEMI